MKVYDRKENPILLQSNYFEMFLSLCAFSIQISIISNMSDSQHPIVAFITYPSSSEEDSDLSSFARKMVDKHLAACVNVLDGIRSFFTWEGNVDEETEHLLIVKSTRERYSELEAYVQEEHPYDVPEIIVFPIEEGASSYLEWISACVTQEELST